MDAKQIAKLLCRVFNTFVPNSAALAGGCLRDEIYKRPVKDLDVWITYFDKRDIQELHNLVRIFTGWELVYRSEDGSVDVNDRRVRDIYTLQKEGEPSIDVIFTNWSIEECVDAFPSSISQIWSYDGKTINTTSAFDKTLETKEILFTQTDECTHVRKIKEYFPEYKFKHIN